MTDSHAPAYVLEWDVVDGGVLGATVVCTTCRGQGKMPLDPANPLHPDERWCQECSGTGDLHREYELEVPNHMRQGRYFPGRIHRRPDGTWELRVSVQMPAEHEKEDDS